MHPILAKPRRFALYLFVFLQAGVLAAELLVASGPASRILAWAVVVPLLLVHAWSCLASWYLCRSTPLDKTSPSRLLVIHLASAAVAGVLLVALGTGWSRLLATSDRLRDAESLFAGSRTLIFVFAFFLFSLAVAVHYVLMAVAASQAAEKRAYELRLLAQEAELKMLRAQIDPHFLFNSLNSISSLVTADPGRAREMCVALAAFLRRSLGLGARQEIPLAEEIALVESYLAVEQIRFGERLRFEREVDSDAGGCHVPPLLLQPLVENAVRHGIAHLVEPGAVRVTARLRASGEGARRPLLLTVENDFDDEVPPRRGSGLGLTNVRRRLGTRYGGAATMEIAKGDGVFRVEIALPARR